MVRLITECKIARPIGEAVLAARWPKESAGTGSGCTGRPRIGEIPIVIACLFQSQSTRDLPAVAECPVQLREPRKRLGLNVVVIMDAVGLIGAEKLCLIL